MAADVKQLFDSGNLSGAIEALTSEVKAHPNDAARRAFLFELLAFSGQLDRAAKQLEVIGHQDIENEMAAQVYINLLHAEGLRRRVFAEGLKPEFLLDPPAYAALHIEALGCLRDNNAQRARELLDESEAARPLVRGRMGDTAFEEFRDCDDTLAPFLELMLIRDYIWLPIEQVTELEISPPERPRDLLWAPVRVGLTNGSQRRAYMPTRYVNSHQHADELVKLGRVTDWTSAGGGPVTGVGQRLFLAGDEAVAMLELATVTFDNASSEPA
jgi:type VI secretion system protein ImpE